jgi:hypothetical protein
MLNSIFAAMKIVAKILLIVFIAFLSTPTIVSLIEKKANTSCFYGNSEEEQMHKEVKAEFKFDTAFEFLSFSYPTSSLILSENLSKHDNVASSILIPPPDQI